MDGFEASVEIFARHGENRVDVRRQLAIAGLL
jgi:hypothetical protein